MFFIRFFSGIGFITMLLACTAVSAGPQDDFIQAIRRNDVSSVQSWMLRGMNPNLTDAQGMPVLVIAAQERAGDVIRTLLISPLTDINAVTPAGETALMYAALHGELDTVKSLVSRQAAVNQPGWTALHYAASAGQLSVVQYLLERNAYIDATSPNGTTPLMMAARQNRITVARHLVEEGADPGLRNEAGLDAADYFERNGESEQALWMRQQSRRFQQRYGVPRSRD